MSDVESASKHGFSWVDVSYGVGKAAKAKQIIENISGSLTAGELCAILGPSGSGKTSLLNILAGRIRNKGEACRVTGNIVLDGQPVTASKQLRKRIAYVMQQDLLPPTQTPREALLFSAQMRLPQTTPFAEKKALVEEMLTDLDIIRCADTYIGDEMIRGISGGEKKRTSIGVELVVRPKLIFLDEPTSGLDSYAAHNVVEKLRVLATRSRSCVLCTIHQPSSEAFHTFDKVSWLPRRAATGGHGAATGCDRLVKPHSPLASPSPSACSCAWGTSSSSVRSARSRRRSPRMISRARACAVVSNRRSLGGLPMAALDRGCHWLPWAAIGCDRLFSCLIIPCSAEYNLADHAVYLIQTQSDEILIDLAAKFSKLLTESSDKAKVVDATSSTHLTIKDDGIGASERAPGFGTQLMARRLHGAIEPPRPPERL